MSRITAAASTNSAEAAPARKRGRPASAPASQGSGPITIEPLRMQEIVLCILGASPLIYNKMSEKAKRELLLPAVRKNAAAKRANLKHNPLQEFRDSMYTDSAPNAPTRLTLPSPAFKAAAMIAALEVPGTTKTSIGRLLQVSGYQVRIWGIPQLFMCGVRMAGIAKTPDIRTRAIHPEWATQIKVRFPVSSIETPAVGNLLAASGQLCGVGDFRQERGKGSFGLFSLVNADDPDFQRIIATQGIKAQDAAIANPSPFDQDSADLWSWFETEIIARGRGGEVTSVEAQ